MKVTYIDWDHPIAELSGTSDSVLTLDQLDIALLEVFTDKNSTALRIKTNNGDIFYLSKEFLLQCKIRITETKE